MEWNREVIASSLQKSKEEAFFIAFVWGLYKNAIKYGNNSIKIEYIKKRTIKTGGIQKC